MIVSFLFIFSYVAEEECRDTEICALGLDGNGVPLEIHFESPAVAFTLVNGTASMVARHLGGVLMQVR